MKITTIIGARPQFIKAAVVSRAIRDQYSDVQETIIHTGQHYDANMSDVFFYELNIPWPDHQLGIGGGTHGQDTGRMIEAIETVLQKNKTDLVLVYGDTDSTLAGALAAVKLKIPVAHVEAGLRSFNRHMPEEINRVLTDQIAELLFTPTDTATRNLLIDNVSGRMVHQVGDVMYDAALYYRLRAKCPSNFVLDDGYILATLHRAENTDSRDRLEQIISALNDIAIVTPVVMPLHPRTRKLLQQIQIDTRNITLLEPVSYLHMVWLLEHCKLVVTDSGGLQKEAYFFAKPCITTRDETEWVELVEVGWNVLVGASRSLIIDTCLRNDPSRLQVQKSLYGTGDAGLKIAKILAG